MSPPITLYIYHRSLVGLREGTPSKSWFRVMVIYIEELLVVGAQNALRIFCTPTTRWQFFWSGSFSEWREAGSILSPKSSKSSESQQLFSQLFSFYMLKPWDFAHPV